MGMRSMFKYLALFGIVRNLMVEGMQWLEAAKDEDSPGGDDITPEEYIELIPIVERAIVDAIGVSVSVSIVPKD